MNFTIAFSIVIISAFIIFWAFLNTPRGAGWIGETRVKWAMGKTVPGQKYVINNLVISHGEGKTSQIDHVLINKNGIFVIETKNYSGRIYGSESQLEWTQVLKYGKVKNKLYNPIKQNATHIYHVSKILNEQTKIISAVVFVKGNTKFIEASGVYSIPSFKNMIKRPAESTLSPEQMQAAYEKLVSAHDSGVSLSAHVKNINTMRENLDKNICPRCGKQLVKRNGAKGEFYGCSGYPKCRFTKQAGK